MSVLRAEKFGDLVTADHKVLNEGAETRHNHRYSIAVQDLANRWISVVPVQNKNFSGDGRVNGNFSSRLKSRKSFTLPIRWNLADLVKICQAIIEPRHLIDLRRMGLSKEQCEKRKRTKQCIIQDRVVQFLKTCRRETVSLLIEHVCGGQDHSSAGQQACVSRQPFQKWLIAHTEVIITS